MEIYWPAEKTWFTGTVIAIDGDEYELMYKDGERWWHRLYSERWRHRLTLPHSKSPINKSLKERNNPRRSTKENRENGRVMDASSVSRPSESKLRHAPYNGQRVNHKAMLLRSARASAAGESDSKLAPELLSSKCEPCGPRSSSPKPTPGRKRTRDYTKAKAASAEAAESTQSTRSKMLCISAKPDFAKPESLVGWRVEAFFDVYRRYYAGVISAYSHRGGQYRIQYDDGDYEWCALPLLASRALVLGSRTWPPLRFLCRCGFPDSTIRFLEPPAKAA
jgi:hypothetical protein